MKDLHEIINHPASFRVLQLNKAKEMFDYCSLKCCVFCTDIQLFLHVSIQTALCMAMSETKEMREAFNIKQIAYALY